MRYYVYIGNKTNTFVTNTIPATAFSYTIVVGCMKFVFVYTGSYICPGTICHASSTVIQDHATSGEWSISRVSQSEWIQTVLISLVDTS